MGKQVRLVVKTLAGPLTSNSLADASGISREARREAWPLLVLRGPGLPRPEGRGLAPGHSVTSGYGRTIVLRSVDIAVAKGTVVALLGPNGAGKTTLLRTAIGLIKPSTGTITVRRTDLTRKPSHIHARHGACLIPEGRGVFGSLTVRDNLRLQIPKWDKTNASVEQVTDAFPVLGKRLHQYAGDLSGGEQQMLALGRAFPSNPCVVLLDEVSMGLAPRIVDELFASLRQLAALGVALLLVEQYVNRAMEMADQIVLLDRGQVSFAGPPSELDEAAVLRHYLGTDG